MFYLSEHRYLSDGSAGYSLRLCLQLDLLDGDNLLRGSVYALVDDTVCALSESGYLLHLVDLTEAERLLHRLVHK